MIVTLLLLAAVSLGVFIALRSEHRARHPKCQWILGIDPGLAANYPETVVYLCVTHRCLGEQPAKRCAVAERTP